QAGFLEHDADGAPVHGQEDALPAVLPDLAADGDPGAGSAFQAGQHAQAGGLAAAGVAEQRGDAMPRQRQVDVEREALERQVGLELQLAAAAAVAHARARRAVRALWICSSISTEKAKMSMTAARRCASAYSSDSTW